MWVLFGVIFTVMMSLDIPWVLLNAKFGIYKPLIKEASTALLAPVWIMMILLNSLLLSFIISHAKTWWEAGLAGMFVGLAVYFTFNGTNIVMFRSWTLRLALMDTCWGMFLFGMAAIIGYFAAKQQKEPLVNTAIQHPASLGI